MRVEYHHMDVLRYWILNLNVKFSIESIETWLLDKPKYPSSKCGHMRKYGNLESYRQSMSS